MKQNSHESLNNTVWNLILTKEKSNAFAMEKKLIRALCGPADLSS